MGDIINLNQFKKKRARSEKEKAAENNRVLFGTPKSLKTASQKQNLLDKKLLEQKRLEKENQNSDKEPKD